MPNLVTVDDVYNAIGLATDTAAITIAQSVVGVYTDLTRYADFTATDQARLRSAIIWEVLYLNQHPSVLTGEVASNVLSAAANGASVTLRADVDAALSPLASKCLDRLSWNAGPVKVQTLRATPASLSCRPQPDPWVTL